MVESSIAVEDTVENQGSLLRFCFALILKGFLDTNYDYSITIVRLHSCGVAAMLADTLAALRVKWSPPKTDGDLLATAVLTHSQVQELASPVATQQSVRRLRRGACAVALPLSSQPRLKEYLNHRGTKIRVFRVRFFFGPLSSHPFPSFFSSLSPFQALFNLPPLLPSSPPPLLLPFFTPGELRFRYPSDLGTL